MKLTKLLTALLCVVGLSFATGCEEEGTVESTSEDAVNEIEGTTENAAEDVDQAAEDAADNLNNATE